MKPQDIVFLVVILVLLLLKRFRRPKIFVISGLICIALSIPLFAFWIFFTAQHLVWYACGFFLVAIILLLVHNTK
ncbi:MAG TPA: hypothetical protein VLB73_03070 [Patescibacteria group bacterium]|nr:hypothetical protein [Patescibacteria group bacterium]